MSYYDMTMTSRPDSTAPEKADDEPARLSRADYVAIAAFRRRLRGFLAFSETSAAAAGLPPQQHQALLAIAGHEGPTPPTVGDLAGGLMIAPHTAAELASRMAASGLLVKTRSDVDRRRVELVMTVKAEQALDGLTAAHLRELRSLEPALVRALSRVTRRSPPCASPDDLT